MVDSQVKTENPIASKSEASKANDAMLNLFAAAVIDEGGMGKFAASLNEVDIQDLLRDARWLRARLKGTNE